MEALAPQACSPISANIGIPTVCASTLKAGCGVGCYDTGESLRVVAGGAVTHRIAIDRGWANAPALGGPDGRTLYMVVDETTDEGLVKGESTGWIMQARVEVPGAGSP